MKRIKVTFELYEDDTTLYSRQFSCRPCDGVPTIPQPVNTNGSGLQSDTLFEADQFWQEILLLGFLDGYVRGRHNPDGE